MVIVAGKVIPVQSVGIGVHLEASVALTYVQTYVADAAETIDPQ